LPWTNRKWTMHPVTNSTLTFLVASVLVYEGLAFQVITSSRRQTINSMGKQSRRHLALGPQGAKVKCLRLDLA
jgi:uncharacterized protein YjeT (DUF2065 family)